MQTIKTTIRLHTTQSSCSFRSVYKYCKSVIHMLSTASIAEWLEGHAGKQGVAGSIHRRRHTLSFWIFCLYSVDNSSAKIIQMKSSMTFIQSNGWTKIDLILKNKGGRFIWWQVSSLGTSILLLELIKYWSPNVSLESQNQTHIKIIQCHNSMALFGILFLTLCFTFCFV